ncbi:hypothetical protein [Microbacterium sp. 77mftsu3.1]|uniref:hypothetical protein n=1 Tax=Microbacterium sp. 77mftsu3.1 TaxID=1761802 RepID=UPI000371BF31|nr:hypothetical protein [Microbacterium sp. 77mftsu3.1]
MPRPEYVEPAGSPVPVTTENVILTAEEPVTRLSRYASGLGNLLIRGADEVHVETTDRIAYRLGRDQVPAPGNRPLIELDEDGVLVGLRHLRQIRRLIAAGRDVTIVTSTGTLIQAARDADVCLHLVAGHWEIRRDTRTPDLAATYALQAPILHR